MSDERKSSSCCSGSSAAKTGIDPVCGMDVDPQRAAGVRSMAGKTFHFCSAACLAKFDADPEAVTRRATLEAPASAPRHDEGPTR